MVRPRLRSTLDREIGEINDDLLRMHKLVDQAIVRSVDSLTRRDQATAQQVIDEDIQINDLRYKIEEACLALIATQQPAAGDLRSIIAAMHMVVEMERMGDHATGIAKTVIRMGDEPLLKPLIDIPRMAEMRLRPGRSLTWMTRWTDSIKPSSVSWSKSCLTPPTARPEPPTCSGALITSSVSEIE